MCVEEAFKHVQKQWYIYTYNLSIFTGIIAYNAIIMMEYRKYT